MDMHSRLSYSFSRILNKCVLNRGSRTSVRYTTRMMSTHENFLKAKENVSKLTEDPGNDVKLKMYALFKQVGLTATVSLSTVKSIL